MREDIKIAQELGEKIAIEELSFETIMWLLLGFSKEQLLNEQKLRELNITWQTAIKLHLWLEHGRLFSLQQISATVLEMTRVQAWEQYDLCTNNEEKCLVRLIICCLYDEASAEFDTYGAEAIIEIFFGCLLDLGEGYCTLFGEYVQQQLKQR